MIQAAITNANETFLNPIPATRNLAIRKSVYDLSEDEILELRRAFAKLQAIKDNRGYEYIAGVHGFDQYFCPHGNEEFLVWHRPYLVMFEQALAAVSPGMALPYWNWASDRALREGLPAIFTEADYVDPATGQTEPNPLRKYAIRNPNSQQRETSRRTAPVSGLVPLRRGVETANRQRTYFDFNSAVEQPHNGLHGWVGGSMGSVPYVAFDPIFWVHHCYVEKLFCDWQDRTSAALPPTLANQVLAPFTRKISEVWDYTQLGYRYAPEKVLSHVTPRAALMADDKVPPNLAAKFSLKAVPDDVEEAKLNFIKTRNPLESFEIRVFFNEKAPTVKTRTAGNKKYAGSLFVFGHGQCTGDAGHCRVPEVPEDATRFVLVRPEHHLTPRRMTLDVTKAVQALKARAKAPDEIDVDLVFVSADGKEIPQDALDFQLLTLDAI